METVTILEENYRVINSKTRITLPESFLKNKINSGHGEAKLYIGRVNSIRDFWEDLNFDCFLLKSNLIQYLEKIKYEFDHPQQKYKHKKDLPNKYSSLLTQVNTYNDSILRFRITRREVQSPRFYIVSDSEYFELIRDLCFPNITFLSVMKIKDNNNIKHLYFSINIDYKNVDCNNEYTNEFIEPEEINMLDEIENSHISDLVKKQLINARIGQGTYRKRLLKKISKCPFTQIDDENLLIASHIKPWSKSNNEEKIDPENGFIFTPTYDKLFDYGYISFTNDKKLIISPWLSNENQDKLRIKDGMYVRSLALNSQRQKEYLEYHREHVFKSK